MPRKARLLSGQLESTVSIRLEILAPCAGDPLLFVIRSCACCGVSVPANAERLEIFVVAYGDVTRLRCSSSFRASSVAFGARWIMSM